jgi:hypothetical protein
MSIFLSSAQIRLVLFEQFSIFVPSSCFSAKSVEQSRVEQSQFEQFTPTPLAYIKLKKINQKNFSRFCGSWTKPFI